MLPVDHPAKQDGDAIAGLHQVLLDEPDYRPPLSVREQLRQQRIQQHQSQYRPPQPGARSGPTTARPAPFRAIRLPGNPHASAAAFVHDVSYPAAALREALLAVAFELRTANLIAAANSQRGLDREVEKLLGDNDPD
ncbi:hypothetical protein [Microlunatus ginsengisoli]|uniref:Uncharacterized protein n=1 Tax=Microlunatus ginsengisoli TaxID=363863 RepID=A0ABP7AKK9_9ACTN